MPEDMSEPTVNLQNLPSNLLNSKESTNGVAKKQTHLLESKVRAVSRFAAKKRN